MKIFYALIALFVLVLVGSFVGFVAARAAGSPGVANACATVLLYDLYTLGIVWGGYIAITVPLYVWARLTSRGDEDATPD